MKTKEERKAAKEQKLLAQKEIQEVSITKDEIIRSLREKVTTLKLELVEKESEKKQIKMELESNKRLVEIADARADKAEEKISEEAEKLALRYEDHITELKEEIKAKISENEDLESSWRNKYEALKEKQEDILKIRTYNLNIEIDLLKGEIASKDSVSRQKHEIQIQKLESLLEVEKQKSSLFKSESEYKNKSVDQMLTTIQIMGTKETRKEVKYLDQESRHKNYEDQHLENMRNERFRNEDRYE